MLLVINEPHYHEKKKSRRLFDKNSQMTDIWCKSTIYK